MNQRYGKNLRALKRQLPYVYDKLETESDQIIVTVEPIEGFKNALITDATHRCYANSLYDTEKEMRRYFEGMDQQCRTVIILGIGTGYALEYISRHYPQMERVILVEPSLSVFKYSLENINLDKFFEKFDLSLIVNFSMEQSVTLMAQMVEERLNTGIHIVTHHYFSSVYEAFHKDLSDVLMRMLRRELSQVATSFNIPYLRLVNGMTNLSHGAQSAEVLIPLMKENTVFIVSAGPSLQKEMHLLEEAKRKGIVIGVGTAIEILDQNGIRPHLRAAFSPHVDTTIFKNLNDDTVPLIYLDSLYHDILPAYNGPLFKLVSTGETLTKYVMDQLQIPYHQLITEVSIANVMVEFCMQIGVKELVLLGQDMAYTGNRLYADGSLWNQVVGENKEGLILEKGNGDQDVYTDIKFIGMRDAIVRSILRYASPESSPVLNCTEGGLKIPYTEAISLQAFLDTAHDGADYSSEISKLTEAMGEETEVNYKQEFGRIVEVIRGEIHTLEEINEKRVELLKELIKEREAGRSPEKIIRKYEEINGFEEQMKAVSLYRDVIQHEFHGIFRSVIMAFKYQGQDMGKQLMGAENMMIRICLEVRKITRTFKMLIDEFYGIEYPEGIGSIPVFTGLFTEAEALVDGKEDIAKGSLN